MRQALREAEVEPASVHYINAHGTATVVGDAVETQAIKAAFGDHARGLAISSTKSMHGHMMGATGAVEFLATVLAVHEQAIPPTANWLEADPDCDLDWVPNIGRRGQTVRYAMSNSFAFGGSNASLIVRRAGTLPGCTGTP
jgi:3-oxoacyl-(acyl-carrier-protein) synthase